MELGEHEPNEPPVADCDCRRCAVATRDALRKDAERYRCLRDKFSWTLTSGPDGTRISVHMPGVDVTAIGPGEDEFDAAIDAAMRK